MLGLAKLETYHKEDFNAFNVFDVTCYPHCEWLQDVDFDQQLTDILHLKMK